MPIIPNRTLRHNKFQYLKIGKRKHDFLELTYPGLPKWLWEIPPERIRGKYIPFHELYYIGYDSYTTEEERNKELLKFIRSKYIRANGEENMSDKEIIEKYKKLADSRYEDDDRPLKCCESRKSKEARMPKDDIHVTSARTIIHSHTEDPEGAVYMDEEDGELGTGLGSVGPGFGAEIGSTLGGHGRHPTITSDGMLHSDALDSAEHTDMSSLISHMQSTSALEFKDQAEARMDLKNADPRDYGGAKISDKGSTFTSHCSNPMPTWGSNPIASGKVGETTLGHLYTSPFTSTFKQGEDISGPSLIGDHRDATFFDLTNKLDAANAQKDLLAVNLQKSEAALTASSDDFFFF